MIFSLSNCIISKIQDFCRIHCECQNSGCTLRHCLLVSRRGRMLSGEKGNRGTTQTCGQRDERSAKKCYAEKGAGVKYPQNHSPGAGATPNHSSWGRKQGFSKRRSFWITRQHSNNTAFQYIIQHFNMAILSYLKRMPLYFSAAVVLKAWGEQCCSDTQS